MYNNVYFNVLYAHYLLDDGSVVNAFSCILLSDRYGLGDLELACTVRNSAPGAGDSVKALSTPAFAFLASLERVNHISLRVNQFDKHGLLCGETSAESVRRAALGAHDGIY